MEEVEGITVLIGVMVGTFTALLLLTIVFCMYYRKKEPGKPNGTAMLYCLIIIPLGYYQVLSTHLPAL